MGTAGVYVDIMVIVVVIVERVIAGQVFIVVRSRRSLSVDCGMAY
jgi:hypothetical protein